MPHGAAEPGWIVWVDTRSLWVLGHWSSGDKGQPSRGVLTEAAVTSKQRPNWRLQMGTLRPPEAEGKTGLNKHVFPHLGVPVPAALVGSRHGRSGFQ